MAKADMFFKLEGAKHGPIKGESDDTAHKDEIEVVSWHWGMRAKTAMSGQGEATKASINELTLVKHVDSASTALMSVIRNNEVIKKGTLSVRKAGGDKLEYLKITIEKGRITGYDVRSVDDGPVVTETLTFSFQKVAVEYVPQASTGGKRGSMLFETEIV